MTISFHSRRLDGTWDTESLKPFTFPAGESHVKGFDGFDTSNYDLFVADIRGHNPGDLFTAALWSDSLLDAWVQNDDIAVAKPTVLIMPYLPAARADRGFANLSAYTQFVADQIVPDQIIYLDPHSPEWARSIKEYAEFPGTLTEFPFERIIKHSIQDKTSDSKPQQYAGVIAPDHGAVDRATRAANVMGVPVYRAGKTRDFETGQLTGFHMEDELPAEGKFLIVDDICDGGGTFIGLAEAIGIGLQRLDLWVTHGVFSKGLEELSKHFGNIHTTDSYYVETESLPWVHVHSVTNHLFAEIK